MCSPPPGKEATFQKGWVSLAVPSEPHHSFFRNSDRWGASPEFQPRMGHQPPGLLSLLASPSLSGWDTCVRGQDDRFSPPQFPAHSAQRLPELSGLRPALYAYVTCESNLVFFCPLGYFPSQTFSFLPFSSVLNLHKKVHPRAGHNLVPGRRQNQWRFPREMLCFPDTGGYEGEARQTPSFCGVTTP